MHFTNAVRKTVVFYIRFYSDFTRNRKCAVYSARLNYFCLVPWVTLSWLYKRTLKCPIVKLRGMYYGSFVPSKKVSK